MLIESVLKNFDIISEELHLPHGARSAKLVCHTDLDGVASGITMVKMLEKQGIPKERITIEFAQYGDEEKDKDFSKRFTGRKGEFIGVTDFAKLPVAKPWDTFFKLTSFKGKPEDLLKILKSSYSTQKSLEDYIKSKFNIIPNQWTNDNYKKLYEAFKAYKKLEELYKHNKKVPFKEATAENIKTLSYSLVSPDFVSDHHNNDLGALNGGQSGQIAVESPSELEYLAKEYIGGLWSKEDVEAISMVDAARYTEEQLKNTVFLNKNFTGPNRKKNLAIIVACVYDALNKKDKSAAAWVVKNAEPSLVSLYNCTAKAAGYNGKRLEYLTALKNGEVEKAKQLLSEIPEELNKRYDRRGNPDKPILTHQQWQKKNASDMEKMKTGRKNEADDKRLEEIKGKRGVEIKAEREKIKSKKGKVMLHHNFAIFDGTDTKQQYTRYATTLYSKNGQRAPFTMRYWGTFFQIAKSPLYKGVVDFSAVNEHVIQDVKNFLLKENINPKTINKVVDSMKQKNGGHAGGIWTFNGFTEIKPDYNEFTDKDRQKYFMAKKMKPSELTQKIIDRYDGNGGINVKYAEIRKRCMRLAMNSAVNWTNKLYPPKQEDLEALKTNDKDFNED